MQRKKYREFVARHPWFPAVVRPLVNWQDYGPGEKDPDRATEGYFYRKVSHLGIIPYTPNILRRKCMRTTHQKVRSPLLGTAVKATQLRTYRIVYHDFEEQPFSRSHNVVHSSHLIRDAITAYRNIARVRRRDRHIDAIIEETVVAFGQMSTERFNVMLFPQQT